MNHTDLKQRLRVGLVLTGLLEMLLFACLLYFRSRVENGLGGEGTVGLFRAIIWVTGLAWLCLLGLFFEGYRLAGVSREVWRHGRAKTAKDAPEDPNPQFNLSMPMLSGLIPVALVVGIILLLGGVIRALKSEAPSPFELLDQGSFDQLKLQLNDNREQIDQINALGDSLLMEVIKQDAFDVVQSLVESGADLEVRNSHRDTAVILAASKPQILSLLLQKGARASVRGWNGLTPLHHAIGYRSAESVELLLSYGAYVNSKANDGRTPLLLALEIGFDDIGMLLSSGANPNLWNAYNEMPLHIAARKNNAAAARLLLQAGAEKITESNQGWTPLHIAALHGSLETAEVLLEFGLNVDIANERTQTPMYCAVAKGDSAFIDMLLAHGAQMVDLEVQANTRRAPASVNEQALVGSLLLPPGADGDAADDASTLGLKPTEQMGAESLLQLLAE